MHRFLIATTLLLGLGLTTLPSSADACPMCKVANEDAPATDADGYTIDPDARPRAYMISILFMLAMPASLLTGFSIAFYRMTRRQSDQVQSGDDHNVVG